MKYEEEETGFTFPEHPDIATWNTQTPADWGMRQCLEFLELMDPSQKKAYSQWIALSPKQGAAKIRPQIINRLKHLILARAEYAAQQQPRLHDGVNYYDLCPEIAEWRVEQYLDTLNKSDPFRKRFLKSNPKFAAHFSEVTSEDLKFIILYMLERQLAYFFPDHTTRCEFLPHLERFCEAYPKLLSSVYNNDDNPLSNSTPETTNQQQSQEASLLVVEFAPTNNNNTLLNDPSIITYKIEQEEKRDEMAP